MGVTIIGSIVIGILSGFVASYIFLRFYLKYQRPKIDISNYISKVSVDGEVSYFFKFVNRTSSEIFDVHIEPTFYKPVGDFNGRNLFGKDITLIDNYAAYIPYEKKNDMHNLHAMRVRTLDNLEAFWEDESSFVRLTIMAKHSLSGLNKVFVKDYLSKDCITSKKFLSGNNLEVK